MELTKEQIEHIDYRLEKEGVKFWDIKIEMLDHVVTDVEKRMELGVQFKDALQSSFQSLGWNGSFESVIQLKQKQHTKFYNKEIHKGFRSFFTSFSSLLIYAILIGFLYTFLEDKSLVKIVFTAIIGFFIAVVAFGLFHYKKVFKSVSLLASFTFLSLALSLLNCSLFIPKVFFNYQSLSTEYLTLVLLVLYPIFFVGYQTFFKKYKKINSMYLKLIQ